MQYRKFFLISLVPLLLPAVSLSSPSPYVLSCKYLDANSIAASFCNNGIFNNPLVFPRGAGLVARGSSGLWIGARMFNPISNRFDTLVSVCFFQSEFVPGYTDDQGVPHGKDDPLYRVYKLILDKNDSDRTNWPNALLGNSAQGAPVYFDTLSKIWRPCDVGDRTMYYVYTDSYYEFHTNPAGSTRPLKADVKQLNFAFNMNGPLGQVCISQFTIINRSSLPWRDAYFTIWSDEQIGDALDDKVGCDSILNLGYSYNGYEIDPHYGPLPPAAAFLLLKGATVHTGNLTDTAYACSFGRSTGKAGYRNQGMTSFNFFLNDSGAEGNPNHYSESYNLMQGLKKNGTCRIHPAGNYCTKFPLNGNPVTGQGWNQVQGGDQRIMVSTGPVTVEPGDSQIIIAAQVVARSVTNLASISAVRAIAVLVQRMHDACLWGCIPGPHIPAATVEHFRLYQNFPNPFNAKTSIRVDVADLGIDRYPHVMLKIYDVLGRELVILRNEETKPGTYILDWDAAAYSSGVYLYEISVSYDAPQNVVYNKTRKMLLIR